MFENGIAEISVKMCYHSKAAQKIYSKLMFEKCDSASLRGQNMRKRRETSSMCQKIGWFFMACLKLCLIEIL